MTEERKEIYIVWMREWRAYRIYLPEHPQKSLGYSVDLRTLQEAARKRYPDREIKVFNDDGERVVEGLTEKDTIADLMIFVAFAVGIAVTALTVWLSSIL